MRLFIITGLETLSIWFRAQLHSLSLSFILSTNYCSPNDLRTLRRWGWLGWMCGISFEFLDRQSVSYETSFIPSLPYISHYLMLVFNHLSLLILSLCLMKGCFNHHGKGKSDLGGFKVTWTKGSKQETQAIVKPKRRLPKQIYWPKQLPTHQEKVITLGKRKGVFSLAAVLWLVGRWAKFLPGSQTCGGAPVHSASAPVHSALWHQRQPSSQRRATAPDPPPLSLRGIFFKSNFNFSNFWFDH